MTSSLVISDTEDKKIYACFCVNTVKSNRAEVQICKQLLYKINIIGDNIEHRVKRVIAEKD